MFDAWLDVLLLRPLPPIRRQTDRKMSLRDAAVMLIGDVREYQHMRYASPAIDVPGHDDASWHDSTDRAIVVGLLNQLLGHTDEAAERFRWVATRSESSDAVATATVLGAIALTERNELVAALEFVDEALARLEVGREKVLLEIHRSVRLAALGQWETAADVAPDPNEIVGDDHVHEILRRTARANASLFRRRVANEWAVDPTPADPLPPTLRWRLSHLASSMAEILEADVRQAYRRSASPEGNNLRASTDHQLWALAFQAACRGHIQHTASGLSTLGRHRVVTDSNARRPPTLETYLVLLDAGDSELNRVARHYLQAGPISDLQSLANIAVVRPWEHVASKPTLELLGTIGQLLDVDTADTLVRRLIGVVQQGRDWSFRDASLGALSGTLAAASDSVHELTADYVLRWREEDNGERFPATLAHLLRWSSFQPALRRRARGKVEQWASGHGGESFGSLLLPLSSLSARWGRTQAARAFQRQPDLQTAAYVLDVGTKAPDQVLERVRDLAVEGVAAEVSQAAAGAYGWGGIDPGIVLTVALLRLDGGDPDGWSTIADYLANPRILARRKEPILHAIAVSVAEMTAESIEIVKGALRAGLTGEAFFDDDSPATLALAAAKTSMAVGMQPPDGTLTHLRRLAGSTESTERLAAAEALPVAIRTIPSTQLIELGMVLLWDGSVDVRATAAARTLDLWQRTRFPRDLAAEMIQRLNSLLYEDGTACPLAILRRLPRLSPAKRPGLADGVLHARHHGSALVRGAATSVVKSWRLPVTSSPAGGARE